MRLNKIIRRDAIYTSHRSIVFCMYNIFRLLARCIQRLAEWRFRVAPQDKSVTRCNDLEVNFFALVNLKYNN